MPGGFNYSNTPTNDPLKAPLLQSPGGPQPFFHNDQDARRSMWRRTPEAMYPDGYLGTIRSRRDDRLLDSVKSREGERNYQRGVHKGERIDPTDYHWLPEWNPMTGLRNEAAGIRTAPPGKDMWPVHLTNRGKPPQPIDQPILVDPHHADQLKRLAPPWR